MSRALARRFESGGRLFVAGNGGSLCDALHIAVEFNHPIIEKRLAFPAIPLMTDIATMTAIGNDLDFTRVYVNQLRLQASPDDVAMVFSTSGKSPNLIYALEAGAGEKDDDRCFLGEGWRALPRGLGLLLHRPFLQHSSNPGSACDRRAYHLGFGAHRVRGRGCHLANRRSPASLISLPRNGNLLTASCPLPITDYKEIVLAHGSGGKLSHQLISKIIVPQFANDLLAPMHDGAIFSLGEGRVAFSTDSYVVSPIFFPGGDIGKLAVHGTVNDLAMCGATPTVSLGRFHPGGRNADGGFLANRPIDARRGGRSRSSTGHGRYQGR